MDYKNFTTLQFGSKGEQVTKVQELVDSLGLFQKPESGYTQFYGERTKSAIQKFQESVGLPVTGECDLATFIKLECQTSHISSDTKPLYPDTNPNKDMQISEGGFELIKKFEGVSLTPYQDAVGVWTIGYGNTYLRDGSRVASDTPKLTLEEAEDLLADIVPTYEERVRSAIKTPLTQNQFDALVSFSFNLGSPRELTPKINNGTIAREDFTAYVYAGGKKLRGLVTRRNTEANLYFDGVYEL